MTILPPDLRQKALSRKLGRNTDVENGHFVFPTIPGTPKPRMVRCHFRQIKWQLPFLPTLLWSRPMLRLLGLIDNNTLGMAEKALASLGPFSIISRALLSIIPQT